MANRKGEEDRTRFRTDRVFVVNNQWYFLTREVENPLGPYASREMAEKALKSFIADIGANLSVPQAVTNLRLLSDPFHEGDF